jgi:WD40-like Beta Propeller Repeat
MTDEQLERRLRDLFRFEIAGDEPAPPDLRASVVAIPKASPAARRFGSRRGFTLLAAAVLVGVLAGSAAIGSRLLTPPPLPPVVPSQPPSLRPSDLQSNQPSNAPAQGRIVFTRWRTLASGEEDCTSGLAGFCRRTSVAISNDDGSSERELFPGSHSLVLAASPDGSKVIVSITESSEDHTYLTDVDGSEPRPLDTHCQAPCLRDFAFTFSADGSRLAFMRTRSGEPGPSGEDLVIATMDMATGLVTELESSYDYPGRPGLSPDGRRVAFGNYMVDVDGSNLHEIAPADLFTDEQFPDVFSPGLAPPAWSPDGSLIAFASSNATFPTNPPERNSQERLDIYAVRPDGSELRRLTTDAEGQLGTNAPGSFGASFPIWTRDGRIAFSRYPAQSEDLFELWVMDADGSNATRVDSSSAAALTVLGCVVCAYPARPLNYADPSFAFWIPAR